MARVNPVYTLKPNEATAAGRKKKFEGIANSEYKTTSDSPTHFFPENDSVRTDGVLTVSREAKEASLYPQWLPTWNPELKFVDEPAFNHVDRGFFADPELRRLFPQNGKHDIKKLTPKFGSVVEGIQLSELSNDQKDDLALFVAQRGVVVFRDQNLKDKSLSEVKKFGQHFGPLHIHQTSGAPEGHPEFHISYKRSGRTRSFEKKVSAMTWHSDVTYELQPPGTTFLEFWKAPRVGEIQLLQIPSRHMREDSLARGSIQRKKFTSENVHPLVRYHPVLGKKSIFAKAFGTRIIGLKQEESDLILQFIENHIATALDLQLRASYEPGTVVAWDNRRALHSALFDFLPVDSVRHCFRITPIAERPVGSREEYENWSPSNEERTVEEWEQLYQNGIPGSEILANPHSVK
uniref:Alpha-ketoglutarate-dependent sulfonate dioxygenase n=1 Tax=Komagataella phaffii (strain GS115 / ATCC 20864) TaxID=644223 RepID=C4R9D4_KOMPG|nr:Alpha-ketoglutarate-dependent sulfonate dioxygenase [Komagataella pastoris]